MTVKKFLLKYFKIRVGSLWILKQTCLIQTMDVQSLGVKHNTSRNRKTTFLTKDKFVNTAPGLKCNKRKLRQNDTGGNWNLL